MRSKGKRPRAAFALFKSSISSGFLCSCFLMFSKSAMAASRILLSALEIASSNLILVLSLFSSIETESTVVSTKVEINFSFYENDINNVFE